MGPNAEVVEDREVVGVGNSDTDGELVRVSTEVLVMVCASPGVDVVVGLGGLGELDLELTVPKYAATGTTMATITAERMRRTIQRVLRSCQRLLSLMSISDDWED